MPTTAPTRHPTLTATLRAHYLLYLSEALELAAFMFAAVLATWYLRNIPNPWLQRSLMGAAMGLTAIAIIKSPPGRLSGAHFNPAISLTFFRLGKIGPCDTPFYILFQFLGGPFGVYLATLIVPARSLAAPNVAYAVTIPGLGGPPAAFAAEFLMAALLMAVVLASSQSRRFAPYTTYLVGLCIANYILFLAPISGFSINPARTLASALFAHRYTALWLYFTAPLLGMLTAAQLFLHLTTPAHPYLRHRHLQHRLHS